jgi:predicted DNA-binding antitoxin AbrB/MazE fold protein
MTRQLEAVFKQGVLRPVEPLLLAEDQRVLVTISDIPDSAASPTRADELQWLRLHQADYRGQWVALQGSELISHGAKATNVRTEARQKGVLRPLMVHVPDEPDLPSAGWL